MDPSIPKSAAILLDFIRQTEVGTSGPSGYDVIYGFNQGKLPKRLTQMTLAEVQAAQPSWTRNFKSSAAGGYQFMRATLGGLIRELGLSGSQLLDANLQDRLGYHLLKRRGYLQWMAGTMSGVEFGKRLAQEWASFPVLAATKGAHRQLARGQSYYSGDKLNKALVSPSQIENLLARARAATGDTPVEHDYLPPIEDTEPPVAPETPATGPVDKAIGAGKGAATGGVTVGGGVFGLVFLMQAYGLIPDGVDNAAFGAAIGALLTGIGAFIMAVIGAYRAPPNNGG